MKRLAVAALLLLTACEKSPSKLDATRGASGAGGAGGGTSAEVEAALSRIESRLAALEQAHTPGAHSAGGQGEASIVERTHRLEAGMARYGEALEFLNKVYAQQKAQQEAQEANEPDPNAVFAVNIDPAIKAGQVDGPNNALVTIVEAWDFA